MNRIIPRIGSVIVTAAVFLFAICLIVNVPFGSYLVCMFLPIGYIMMAAGLHDESDESSSIYQMEAQISEASPRLWHGARTFSPLGYWHTGILGRKTDNAQLVVLLKGVIVDDTE